MSLIGLECHKGFFQEFHRVIHIAEVKLAHCILGLLLRILDGLKVAGILLDGSGGGLWLRVALGCRVGVGVCRRVLLLLLAIVDWLWGN